MAFMDKAGQALKTREKRGWTIRPSQLVPVRHGIAVCFLWQDNRATAFRLAKTG